MGLDTRHPPCPIDPEQGSAGVPTSPSSALRLAERGYGVTVYEERSEIDGNVGGYQVDGGRYDVTSVRASVPSPRSCSGDM
jgi:hypothetical protein